MELMGFGDHLQGMKRGTEHWFGLGAYLRACQVFPAYLGATCGYWSLEVGTCFHEKF